MAIIVSCPHCLDLFPTSPDGDSGPAHCPHCAKPFFLTDDVLADGTTWYLQRGGKKFGPFTVARLRELVDHNRVLTTDQLTRVGVRRWVQAGALQALFPLEDVTPAPPSRTTMSDSDDMILFDAAGKLIADAGPRGLRLQPRAGLTLDDFQIVRKLGAGGMGAVFLAWQRSLGRKVALKVLATALAGQREYVDRFHREADILAGLAHPNIIAFYGTGGQQELPYFAMEYVEGISTAAAQRRFGGRLPVRDALFITLRCAQALCYAHAHRIVHRDIKPENVLITRLGHIKITDLGLAKPLGEDTSLTESGAVLGTPKYMAPEQARNAKRADARSDLYALGGVLYHFLTGFPPFAGESVMDLLAEKERGQFRPARRSNPEVPGRLDLILDKLLARDPRYRYQTGEELIGDLQNLGLAGSHLSFNPLRVFNAAPGDPEPVQRIEILLVHDRTEDVITAQEALEENGLPGNLSAVPDGQEALAYLRGDGRYTAAPRPALILLGRNLDSGGTLDLLSALQADDAWRTIPVVLLADDGRAADVLRSRGLHVSLSVAHPDGKRAFAQLVRSLKNLYETVVAAPGTPRPLAVPRS